MVMITLADIQRALRLPAALIEMGEIWSLDEATMACIFTLHDDLWHNTIDQVLPFANTSPFTRATARHVLYLEIAYLQLCSSQTRKIEEDDEGFESVSYTHLTLPTTPYV